MVKASFLPSFRSKKTAPIDAMMTKPRRVLGLNTDSGRGWVFSLDQSRLRRPEYLFLDTPSHPNLQMVCSRIIDQHGKDLIRMATRNNCNGNIGIHDIACEGLTFSFAIRYVCPEKDAKLVECLESVYFDGETTGKHGIIVMVPAMNNVLWGCHCGHGVPSKMKVQEVDRWIEGVAISDSSPI